MKTRNLVARLRMVADNGTDSIHPVKLIGLLSQAAADLERLDGLMNSPHTVDFLEAVKLEAAHQQERWGTEHDAGKKDSDWFWLVGFLAGKALGSGKRVDEAMASDSVPDNDEAAAPHRDKRLHHIITTAAACLNWHAALTGANTAMRPGHGEEFAQSLQGSDRP